MKKAITAAAITLGSLVGCITPSVKDQHAQHSSDMEVKLEQRENEDRVDEEIRSGLFDALFAEAGISYFTQTADDFIGSLGELKYFKVGEGNEAVLGFASIQRDKPIEFIAVNSDYLMVKSDSTLAKLQEKTTKELSANEFHFELHKTVLQAYSDGLKLSQVGADSMFRAVDYFLPQTQFRVQDKDMNDTEELTVEAKRAIEVLHATLVKGDLPSLGLDDSLVSDVDSKKSDYDSIKNRIQANRDNGLDVPVALISELEEAKKVWDAAQLRYDNSSLGVNHSQAFVNVEERLRAIYSGMDDEFEIGFRFNSDSPKYLVSGDIETQREYAGVDQIVNGELQKAQSKLKVKLSDLAKNGVSLMTLTDIASRDYDGDVAVNFDEQDGETKDEFINNQLMQFSFWGVYDDSFANALEAIGQHGQLLIPEPPKKETQEMYGRNSDVSSNTPTPVDQAIKTSIVEYLVISKLGKSE